MQVEKISFDEISEVWASDLWKDRQSPIKPMSSMLFLGGYDMSIYNNAPTFFAVKEGNKIVAVNSGHMTIDGYYRSRGLWVDQNHRHKGHTYSLFNALFEVAKSERAKFVWSLPKDNSVGAYLKNGFHTVGDLTNDFELGPHYYVLRHVD